jgi:hypothetical protein
MKPTLLADFARGLFLLLATPIAALAQAPAAPLSPTAPVTPAPQGAGTGVATVVALLVLLAIIVVAVKLYDLKRKREEEALALEARISDALLVHPSLTGLPVIASAHVPMFGRSAPVVEVSGTVPTDELRQAALEVVRRELPDSDVRIEDRIVVDPVLLRRVA